MSKRILFADDDPRRYHHFEKRYQGSRTTIWSPTAADAVDALCGLESWHEINLDHDFTGTYQNSAEKTSGMEIVRHIIIAKPDIRTIVVHSHNEIASPLMVEALENAGYYVIRAPFTFKDDSNGFSESSNRGQPDSATQT